MINKKNYCKIATNKDLEGKFLYNFIKLDFKI